MLHRKLSQHHSDFSGNLNEGNCDFCCGDSRQLAGGFGLTIAAVPKGLDKGLDDPATLAGGLPRFNGLEK